MRSRGLVDEWLGSVPERAESYRARVREIDEKLHKLRNTRHKKIAMLVASLDDENDQKLIDELKPEVDRRAEGRDLE
jgi:predicted component of type VI protein secretion system